MGMFGFDTGGLCQGLFEVECSDFDPSELSSSFLDGWSQPDASAATPEASQESPTGDLTWGDWGAKSW